MRHLWANGHDKQTADRYIIKTNRLQDIIQLTTSNHMTALNTANETLHDAD